MNIHSLIDVLTINVSAVLLRNSKFFRESVESPPLREHLKAISLELPDFKRDVDCSVSADTLIGKLNAAFRIAQWGGEEYPTIIYHHGSNENPYDMSFRKIFSKVSIDANLIVVRAPFNEGLKEYREEIKSLASFTAMLAVSANLIESLVNHFNENGCPFTAVTGISLGGFVANIHHAYHNTADAYIPLLAGTGMGDLFVDSIYRKLVAPQALENSRLIQETLNFDRDFAGSGGDNVYPLLARHDQIIVFERQKQCYDEEKLRVMNKGHVTGAMAYSELREHILNVLSTMKAIG